MKNIVSTVVALAVTLVGRFAFAAEGTCYINGETVPCPEIPAAAGAAFIALPILFAIVGLAMFVFWVMMLVHAAKHPIKDKVLWIIVLIIGGILGAVIYYFVVKRHFQPSPAAVAPAGPPPTATPPPAAPVA